MLEALWGPKNRLFSQNRKNLLLQSKNKNFFFFFEQNHNTPQIPQWLTGCEVNNWRGSSCDGIDLRVDFVFGFIHFILNPHPRRLQDQITAWHNRCTGLPRKPEKPGHKTRPAFWPHSFHWASTREALTSSLTMSLTGLLLIHSCHMEWKFSMLLTRVTFSLRFWRQKLSVVLHR